MSVSLGGVGSSRAGLVASAEARPGAPEPRVLAEYERRPAPVLLMCLESTEERAREPDVCAEIPAGGLLDATRNICVCVWRGGRANAHH